MTVPRYEATFRYDNVPPDAGGRYFYIRENDTLLRIGCRPGARLADRSLRAPRLLEENLITPMEDSTLHIVEVIMGPPESES